MITYDRKQYVSYSYDDTGGKGRRNSAPQNGVRGTPTGTLTAPCQNLKADLLLPSQSSQS